MATIKSALVLNDRMTAVLRSITRTLDLCVNGLEGIEVAGEKAFDPSAARQMHIAIGEANARLDEMEAGYRTVAAGQQKLNQQMQQGAGIAEGFVGKIRTVVGAYAGLKALKSAVELSDEMTQTAARINLMNDGLQSTDALMNSIFQSAQRSRGDYMDMAAVVAKFGNNARDAFSSSGEVVQFSELVQKQMKIAGASGTEASNAMLQLSQALGSGVLRGDELNSIFEQAPNLIQSIADYMGKPIGQMRELASDGKITADIVKNAMFAAADDINTKFEQMPMSWGDVFTRFKNDAVFALQPVLDEINNLANNANVQQMLSGVTTAISIAAKAAGGLLRVISGVYNFFVDNWSTIAPIVLGVAAVIGTFNLLLHASEIAQFAAAAAAKVHELGQRALGFAIMFANSNLLIGITIVAAVVAGIILLCRHIAKTSDIANSTFGVIMGSLAAAGAFILNTVIGLVNAIIQFVWTNFVEPFLGIVEWVLNVCNGGFNSFGDAVANLIGQIISWFLSLGKVVTHIIDAIFGTDWTSGLSSMQDKVLSWGKNDNAITIDRAAPTIDYRVNYGDAFATGAAWGDGVTEKVKNKISDITDKLKGNFDFETKLTGGIGETATGQLGSIADDTGSIAKSLDITNEELQWLRDIAEREAVNRFTTAEIKVDMSGMNNSISSDMDIDGVISKLTTDVDRALRTAAAGVH